MNLVASAPGGMGLLQLVHVANVIAAAFSFIIDVLGDGFVNVRLAYILYVSYFATLLSMFFSNI
jgi:hypothetical protein